MWIVNNNSKVKESLVKYVDMVLFDLFFKNSYFILIFTFP